MDEILTWASDPALDQSRILWLYGLAGMGKSTLASTVCRSLEGSHLLGGAFFFSRTASERSNPEAVFSAIASQLAGRIPGLVEQMGSALVAEPDLAESAPDTQFRKLITAPLSNAKHLALPVVIVFDALDECTAPSVILSVIRKELVRLPSVIKVFVTSRPDQTIRAEMVSMGSSVRTRNLDHHADADGDIDRFISDRMADMAVRFNLSPDWVAAPSRAILVRKAGGLFIWASTAMKFIEDDDVDDPEAQLDLLLHAQAEEPTNVSPLTDLDALYFQVLEQAFSEKAPTKRFEMFRMVVGASVSLKEPLSASGLCSLLGLQVTPGTAGQFVMRAVRKLHSVLVVTASKPLQIIHPSFVNFLTEPTRCRDLRF
jgi:hypothetical protein